jgi:hypothetical protein
MKTVASTASSRRKIREDHAMVSGSDTKPFAIAATAKTRKKMTRGRIVISPLRSATESVRCRMA